MVEIEPKPLPDSLFGTGAQPCGTRVAVERRGRRTAGGRTTELGGVGGRAGGRDGGTGPLPFDQIRPGNRVIGHQIVGAAGIARCAQRRIVVVDPAEIGFPVHRRIGDGRRGRGESGPGGIGGQQGRAVRLGRVAPQAFQHFGPALHHRHRMQRHRMRARKTLGSTGTTANVGRIATGVPADPVDLDRRIRGSQIAVGNQSVTVPDLDRITEFGDLGDARRRLDRLMREHRPSGAGGVGVEIVAQYQHPDALIDQCRRQSGRGPAVGDEPLHRVHRADRARRSQWYRVAYRPRGARQRLERFVSGQAPDLAAERCSRHHQCTGVGGVLGQPVRGLLPVPGHLVVGAARGELSGPGQ